MATLKGQTIAASYQDLVKRADTYAQTGTNVEIMDDSAVVQPTGLYLESGATTDNVGIGVSDPDELLELYKVGTQLKLSGGAADYATFAVAADGALTITTVDVDAAEADIILAPDGNIGIGNTSLVTWTSTLKALQLGGNATMFSETTAAAGNAFQINTNAYHNNGWKYITANDEAVNYTQADGSHLFRVSTSTSHAADSAINWIEALRINSSGNVGIGDSSPDALLSIKGDSDANTTPSIRLKDGSDTREAWITNESGDLKLVAGGNDNTPHCQITLMDGNMMLFKTSNDEKMRIDSSGNVGIGETSPETLLHVKQGDSGLTVHPSSSIYTESTTAKDNAISILTGTSGKASLFLSAGNSGSPTYSSIEHDGNVLTLKNNNLAAITIDSSRNATFTGDVTVNSANFTHTSSTPVHYINSTTAGKSVIKFQSEGATKGGVGLAGRFFGTNVTDMMMYAEGGDGIYLFTNGNSSNPSLVLGSDYNATFAGDVLSNSHNSSNLGSDGVRWANLYVADVQMSNEGTGGNEIDGTEGSWTIQEGEEDLFLLNRKNGKKFKIKLEEIE